MANYSAQDMARLMAAKDASDEAQHEAASIRALMDAKAQREHNAREHKARRILSSEPATTMLQHLARRHGQPPVVRECFVAIGAMLWQGGAVCSLGEGVMAVEAWTGRTCPLPSR